MRRMKAQRDAERHDASFAAYQLEAREAERAAAETQQLQSDLLQLQRTVLRMVLE